MAPKSIPVFPYFSIYAGDFNYRHVEWEYNITKHDGMCLVDWADNINLTLLHNSKDPRTIFFAGSWYEPRRGFRNVLEKFSTQKSLRNIFMFPTLTIADFSPKVCKSCPKQAFQTIKILQG